MENSVHTNLLSEIPNFSNPFSALIFGSSHSGKTLMTLSTIDLLIQSGLYHKVKMFKPTQDELNDYQRLIEKYQFHFSIADIEVIDQLEPRDLIVVSQTTINTNAMLDFVAKFEIYKKLLNENRCGIFIITQYPLFFLKLYNTVDILVFKRLNLYIVNQIKTEFEKNKTKYGMIGQVMEKYYMNGFKFKEKESIILIDNKNSHLINYGIWKNL